MQCCYQKLDQDLPNIDGQEQYIVEHLFDQSSHGWSAFPLLLGHEIKWKAIVAYYGRQAIDENPWGKQLESSK